MDTLRSTLPVILIFLISFLHSTKGQIRFETHRYVFFVNETTPVGTVLTSSGLSGGDGLQVVLENADCIANITSRSTTSVHFDVILNTTLDYDYGSRQLLCTVHGSSSDGQNTYLKLTIIIEDVNDVTPELINQPYSVSVAENTATNTEIYKIIDYKDPDVNDVITYKLSTTTATGQDTFDIDPASGHIILKGTLDFETFRFYHYIVTAVDKVGHIVSADVFITVEDVQDTPPEFTGEPFLIKITEDQSVGTGLLTIRAADGDRGVSNTVTLKIINETCKGLFVINKTSGVISLQHQADRDAGEVFINSGICSLVIQATEGNQYPQVTKNADTANTSVTVTILDVNDNDPAFSQTRYKVMVDENTQQGVPINLNTPIQVTDADQGTNAEFDVIVLDLSNYFEVTPSRIQSSGEVLIRVKNSSILDYETNHTLTLRLEAKDSQGNGKSVNATVDISINNINDNSPVFCNSTFYASVPENSPQKTYVTTITASDADEPDGIHNYNKITYTLQGSDSSFLMDKSSGVVTVNSPNLDRERKSVYYLTVIAEDGGNMKTNTLLEIAITDKNDEAPVFVTSNYQTSLKEGQTTFLQPIKVYATDKDEPNNPNSEIIYTINSTLPPGLESHFSLDPDSGQLTVVSALEFEKINFTPGDEGNIKLIIEAKDKGSPVKSSKATISVNLQDVNNHSPECDKSQYSASVSEDSGKSASVIEVTARDGDGTAPNNVYMFSIDQDSAGKFIINSSSGLLSLREQLDREEMSHYDIIVTVTDFGVPARSNSCQVSLDVLDINDSPPTFMQKTNTTNFDENTMGLSVKMPADDKDLNHTLEYKIIWGQSTAQDPSGQNANLSILQNWLQIDKHTGIISNKDKFDRELIERFTLTVQVEDVNSQTGLQADTATITVSVLDKNDKKPAFSQSSYNGKIQENMPGGSEVNLYDILKVTDEDQGDNSEFELGLMPGNVFSVTPSSGKGQSQFSITVHNSTALDYEVHDKFIIQITATETKTAEKFSNTATVTISINNINDNMPEFENAPFSAKVLENQPVGTSVTTVTANDKDKSPYGAVTYTFVNNQREFTINKMTGEVLTTIRLDREHQEIYTLSVRANDIGNFASTTQLTITVDDDNDNYPRFLQNDTLVTITENDKYFMPSLLVMAIDGDAPGINSQITYSLLSSKPASLTTNFTVNPSTSEITMKSPLDYEKLDPKLNGTIYLTIEAKDQGVIPLSSTASVTIIVQDANDLSPEFTKQSYSTDVQENLSLGGIVFNVKATDHDITKTNHDLRYTIDTLSGSIFKINDSSGEITLKSKLDYESIKDYNITITALDHGSPVQTGTAVLHVKVQDVNDEKPQFQQNQKSISQKEHVNIQFNCSAEDKDSNKNLQYSIEWDKSTGEDGQGAPVKTNELQSWITINKTTGIVKTLKLLDREEVSEFVLQVTVEDMAAEENKPQTATATLTIIVKDVNDQAPVFTFGSLYIASIRENMPEKSDIEFENKTSLEVHDSDGNETYNSFDVFLLTYNTTFSINPTSGNSKQTFTISVLNSSVLDYEINKHFSLEVLAIDSNDPSLSSSATILVNVINENDNIPEFIDGPYKADVPENSKPLTSVIIVDATDSDDGLYGEVTYSLDDTSNTFAINTTSGEVYLLNVSLDRENCSEYTVTLTATDSGGFRATTQLIIEVSDINDNAPVFANANYSLTFNEGISVILPEFFVQATDKDDPDSKNSHIQYTLLDNKLSPQANFSVDPKTGKLILNSPLDRELLAGPFILKIQAEDQGVPPKSANVSVEVTVLDINDNAPVFKKDNYITSIHENASPGASIFNVVATDADVSSNNHEVSYTIDTLSGSIFKIDSNSGEITLKSNLDYESIKNYSIILTALDHGSPVQTGTAVLHVTVEDVNDVNPQFLQTQESFSQDEHTNFQHTCSAGDKDSNNDLVYSIQWDKSTGQNGQGTPVNTNELRKWIAINNKTGTVRTLKLLDREEVSEFVLNVAVEDIRAEVNRPQTATAMLTLTVNDVNDQAPIFTSGSSYIASIRENMPEKSNIEFDNETTLEVYDADSKETNSHFDVFLLTHNTTFSISPTSGNSKQIFTISILNSSVLDYEMRKNFTLEVLAIDPNFPSLNSSATILVNIVNENDNIPEFVGGPYKAAVPEDSKRYTKVILVNAIDGDDGLYGELTYSLADTSKTFAINNISGEVYLLNDNLDRENRSEYTVTLTATDKGGFRATTQLIIGVSDINDNAPVFAKANYNLTFDEGIVEILPEFFVQATDKDDPNSNNSHIQYTLLDNKRSPQANFSVDRQTGKLTLTSPLDYESLTGPFILKVQAEDQGIPPKSANVSVKVTVLDINDNAPGFKKNTYSSSIYENAAHDTFIEAVSATDKDLSTSNNIVTYLLDTLSARTFSIDTNGTITLKDTLDREQTASYIVIVTAKDNGQPALTSTTSVIVTVLDVNDSPPTFSWNSKSFTVKENSKDLIAKNRATDPDTNPDLYYLILWSESTGMDGYGRYISGDSLMSLVKIINNTGEVYPLNWLDREKVQRFQLTLVVEDRNNIPDTKRNDTAILTVTVEDEDDNPPTFNGDYLTATIQENMPKGSEIKMINVPVLIISDPDAGGNSMYNITLEDTSVFTISPSQGDGNTTCSIKVADSSVLDYEQHQDITIKVIATDLLTLTNDSCIINISISNINDNFPKFNQSSFTSYVPENAQVGYTITTLEAHDADLGDFGTVQYFIDEAQTRFTIDKTTGIVKLNTTELDRETKDSYTVTVKARDTGNFEGSTQLIIRVTDYNDRYPKFEFASYSAEIMETDTVFKVPLFVKATDDDEPETNNSKISYSITDIPTEFQSSNFHINDATGEITLTSKAPDYENLTIVHPDGIVQLQVTATDWGIPPLNTSVLVNVTVTDSNDEVPTFLLPSYSGSVKENAAAAESIVTISAVDKDGTSPNNEVYYVILSGSRDKLQINSTTGLISVGIGAKLDRDTTEKNGFNLIVLAIDKGSSPKTGSATVSVTVEDVNDLPPEITPLTAVFPVYENASVGFEIGKFNATDEDEDHDLEFRLLWDESHASDEKDREINVTLIEGWLNIDPMQGTITVKSNMDRELVEQIILKVVVTDKKAVGSPQDATATVTVSLSDVNDNPPVISNEGGALHLNVSEGTKEGTEVSTLTATDADKRQNVIFALTNTDSFHITNSGLLTLVKSLDRESNSSLSFEVIATDNGEPPKSSSITVFINVLDINDNDPVLNDTQITFFVVENSNNQTLVAIITASDKDAGDNGNVTFEFKDTSPFRINATTGQIFVSEHLDRETTPSYILTVIAMDNPSMESRRRASMTINIEIIDVNDNPPKFQSSSYEGMIPETENPGSSVTITPNPVSANDADIGNNSIITFSFVDPEFDFFDINASTGEVFVNKSIRGKPGDYSYIVNASDHGDPVMWTQVNVTITILDENINKPVFVKLSTNLSIPECALGDKLVYTFKATDDDKDKKTNGKVQYFLDTSAGIGNNFSQYFDLNEDTGELTTSHAASTGNLYDKERLSEIVIQVNAIDSGIPPNTVPSGPIHIKIIDINDNPPEFNPNINTNFSVQEEESHVRVGSVKGFDRDESSRLSYSISDIDPLWKDYFSMTTDLQDGGIIYVDKALDREAVTQINMKIRATDLSSSVDSSLCGTHMSYADTVSAPLDVTIFVMDVNDNPPVFSEKSLSVGFLSSTKFGEKIVSLQSHVRDNDTAANSIHGFYQVGNIEANSDISKTWTTDVKPDPIRIDQNGTVSTNYKFSEDAYGFFHIQVLVNDSAGSDMLNLKVYVVGESQVVHITLWYTEDELRTFQQDIARELGHTGYQFVPDNILPAYADDGSVDRSKSVLVTHAIDSHGNIISGNTLVDTLDSSPAATEVRNKYKMYKTESGDEIGKHAADTSGDTVKYILIGVIAVVFITFVITLALLMHTIRRFKTKLAAATLEVHAMAPDKQDVFPGLENDHIKLANPIFMRDDLILEHNKFANDQEPYNRNNSDTLSNASENSLDRNALSRERTKSVLDEQEVTLDVHENEDTGPGLYNLYSHLHFRYSDTLQHDGSSLNTEDRQARSDVDSNKDLNEVVNMDYSNFETTDI